MSAREKLIQKTIDLHREITKARLTRRDLLKMGMLAAGSGLLLPIKGLSLRAAWAQANDVDDPLLCPRPISPPTRPWVEEMPRLVEKATVAGNNPVNLSWGNGGGAPGPDPIGTASGGDSKIKVLQDFPQLATATPYANLSHQAWGKGGPNGSRTPEEWYEMWVRQFNHRWHQDMPAGATGQPAWGFDSMFPGPMYRVRYNRPHFVRIHNDLPFNNLGFGINQISTHLHNAHTPSESDGNPLFFNSSGHYWDYHYPNIYAGGDSREALGSCWYHDHMLDFTAQNVYAGLAGMTCIYDDLDSGDPDEARGLRLPCGPNYEFDVGMVLHDRQFDPEGRDFFPLACFDGALGDKMTVNGKIQPYFPVKRRKYRFRMLNIGPSRFYQWFLKHAGEYVNMTVIGNDGNLLPAPVSVRSFKQAVAERFDIIIDFSQYRPGQALVLMNRAEQLSARGPTGNLLAEGDRVLKFIVTGDPVVDNSVIPERLRDLPAMEPVLRSRQFKFDRNNGEWTLNLRPFDRDALVARVPLGQPEEWTIVNAGGSWSHPVHVHFEEHRILRYNGATVPDPTRFLQGGRKDVIRLDPNARVKIYIRFRDFKGIYPIHCHNVVHEDHAMMGMFKVE